MKVHFHELGSIEDSLLSFVVVPARYQDKWIFVRHKARDTWEMPGGHIEPGETVVDAAKRELYEESGAEVFEMEAVCDYCVEREEATTYGRLFICRVDKLGRLPELEIGEVRLFDDIPEKLTYPNIQSLLFKVLNK